MQPRVEHLGFLSRSEETTRLFGVQLGRAAAAGDLILLRGPFGAGKTTLVQGIGAGLEVGRQVTSPSFTLVNEYDGRVPLYHVDLYRLNELDVEMEQAIEGYEGFEGLTVIEWPDLLPEDLREGGLQIDMELLGDDERSIVLHTPGTRRDPSQMRAMIEAALRGISMILALDTSTAIASVALYDGSVSAEITWRSGRGHSMELMAQLSGLMKLRRIEPQQLSLVAVAIGPGSYTGVRVGLSAGKGLCLALGIPMVGICTLDILAEANQMSCLPVRPLLDAGRHRYATALYRKRDGRMQMVTPVEGKSLREVVKDISERTLICGDVSQRELEEVPAIGDLIELAPPAASLRRAGFLAEIGWERLQQGQVEDAALVDAVYLNREG